LSGRTGQSATTPFGSTSTFQGGGFTSGYQGGYMGGSFFTGGQTLGPRLNTAPTISSQILRGGVFSGLRDTVRLVVDDVNNTLIIVATQADYAFLLETIKKMDVLPRQAIIDARIFEVDLTDALSFGVSGVLQGTTTDPASHLTGGAIDAATGALSANTFAFVGNSREILLKLNALREKTKVRILEAPSVLALDGSVARIVVGSEIPYPGASFTSSEGSITQSVQYRDTGISLIVQPRISASGSVTLAITQEVSSPGAQTSSGPTFSKTSVETVLSVKDGETVAIAGLIRDSHSFVRGGVPLLSEIPILGSLFGVTNRTVTRSELIILITPHVIRTPEKFQEMTQELKDSLRNVRKWADEKEKEHVEDMEDARRERYDRDRKRLEKTEPESK
jgi:general secretion pathway protein D